VLIGTSSILDLGFLSHDFEQLNLKKLVSVCVARKLKSFLVIG
jgi:hypothetical protein